MKGAYLAGLERGAHIVLIFTDAGYRGLNAPPDHRFKVFTRRQKRGVTPQTRQMQRRAAIERVIGQLKAEHRAPLECLSIQRCASIFFTRRPAPHLPIS